MCGPVNYIQLFAKVRDLGKSIGPGLALRLTTGTLNGM